MHPRWPSPSRSLHDGASYRLTWGMLVVSAIISLMECPRCCGSLINPRQGWRLRKHASLHARGLHRQIRAVVRDWRSLPGAWFLLLASWKWPRWTFLFGVWAGLPWKSRHKDMFHLVQSTTEPDMFPTHSLAHAKGIPSLLTSCKYVIWVVVSVCL